MRSRDLDFSIAVVRRMLESWGSGSVHEQQLRWILRELKTLRKGGKIDSERAYRVVALLSEVVNDQFCAEKAVSERL